MSDHLLLITLFDQYNKELNNRKAGQPHQVWENGQFVQKSFRPNNKSRLRRLRLEITRLMLQMERKMDGFPSSMDEKEGWV